LTSGVKCETNRIAPTENGRAPDSSSPRVGVAPEPLLRRDTHFLTRSTLATRQSGGNSYRRSRRCPRAGDRPCFDAQSSTARMGVNGRRRHRTLYAQQLLANIGELGPGDALGRHARTPGRSGGGGTGPDRARGEDRCAGADDTDHVDSEVGVEAVTVVDR